MVRRAKVSSVTHSQPSCDPHPSVDLPRSVRTSSFCGSSGCVGVTNTSVGVTVTDTKTVSTATLHFTRAEWAAFVAGVKNGEFDLD